MSKTIEIIHLKNKRSQNVSLPEGSEIEGATMEQIEVDGEMTVIPALIVKMNQSKNIGTKEIMIYRTSEEFGEYDLKYIGTTTVNNVRLHIYENGN